jgi:hypothetical protein
MKPLGELQPLPIFLAIWIEIFMGFIVGLPKFGNEFVIMLWLITFQNMLIFVLCNTPLNILQSLKYSWIISLNSMVCPNLL